jgi:hypothetical protein
MKCSFRVTGVGSQLSLIAAVPSEYLSPREKLEYWRWKTQTLEHLVQINLLFHSPDAVRASGLAASLAEARAALKKLETHTKTS